MMMISSNNSGGVVDITELIALKLSDVRSFLTVRITLNTAVLASQSQMFPSSDSDVNSALAQNIPDSGQLCDAPQTLQTLPVGSNIWSGEVER